MTVADRVAALDDPQLRPFAVVLYVAWADLELGDAERGRVLAQVAGQPWLRPAARAVIEAWVDPAAPPSPAELHRLRDLLGHVAVTSSSRARASLTRLAGAVTGDPEAEAAARALGHELGLYDGEVPPPVTAAPALPAAAVAALAAVLDGSQTAVRAQVREFLAGPDRRAYGLPVPAMRDLVRGWLFELAATGLGARAFPGVTHDGDLQSFMAAFEELGHGDLSLVVKWGVQIGLYGGAVWALGTARHHARLAAIARAEELGCFAMSEVGHGSNVADLETTATYDPATRELIVHTPGESARKEWIGGAAHDARWAVVFAQLIVDGASHGVHAMLVRVREDDGSPRRGVRTGDSGHKLGLPGVDNGRLWFEEVRIPVADLLDRFASIDEAGAYHSPIERIERRFFVMLGTLVGGRISVGASAVSAGRTALAIAVRYARSRRQFGEGDSGERVLLDYPTHRRRLLPLLADGVVLRLAFERLRARHAEAFGADPGEGGQADTRVLETEVAALKVLGSRHGVDAVQAAREACGGQGYLSINRIPELRADVEIFTTFEGDNTVLSQLVAKTVLAGYRKQFADGGPIALLRAIGQRVQTAVLDKNPVETRRGSSAHLRDREFQLDALRYRERRLIATAAARVRKRLAQGLAGDVALLEVQEHLVAVSQAFAERLALEWFAEREAAADPAARPVLAQLGSLSALALLERRAGWFLEDGYFEAAKARGLRKEVEALLAEVAAVAGDVVDAFGIPDVCLAAPIAFFDPAHPRYD